jgi:hypothetical protein
MALTLPNLGKASRYRLAVFSRVLAAVVGSYAVTSLATAALALLLLRLTDKAANRATLEATVWSFALYAALVLWVFATRSATRAWAGLALGAALSGTALMLLKGWP